MLSALTKDEVGGDDMPNEKDTQKPRGPLDERTLRDAGEFTIIFAEDKGFKCRLLTADNYNLLVESNGRRLLIPKHSVKYVVLPTSVSP